MFQSTLKRHKLKQFICFFFCNQCDRSDSKLLLLYVFLSL